MDDLSRQYIHGQAGLAKIDDAMSGDMRDAWIAQTVEQATEAPPPPMWQRTRPAGRGIPLSGTTRLALLALLVAVIAVFILPNL